MSRVADVANSTRRSRMDKQQHGGCKEAAELVCSGSSRMTLIGLLLLSNESRRQTAVS